MTKPAIVLFALVLLVAAVAGLWSGEARVGPLPSGTTLMWTAASGGAAAIVPVRRRLRRAVAIAAAVASFWVAWWAGRREATAAFNECVASGESLRDALALYKATTGKFPTKLSELPRRPPGRLILRGSMWDYERTMEGYDLRLSDWLVTHRATHAQAFTAHK
ncbi:hypothetical protein [Sorangium sp. So ce128]|uniref:hypothetical protein n=1 Tax=Sorangium sp. So ce128 TaxID=3133281 RepID=UPI003F613D61